MGLTTPRYTWQGSLGVLTSRYYCPLYLPSPHRAEPEGRGKEGQAMGEARTVGGTPPSQPVFSACPPNDSQPLISPWHSPNLLCCCDSIFWKMRGLLTSLGQRAPSASPSPSAKMVKVTGCCPCPNQRPSQCGGCRSLLGRNIRLADQRPGSGGP